MLLHHVATALKIMFIGRNRRCYVVRKVRIKVFVLWPGCSEPLGMKSGHIQDYQVMASSIFRTLNMDMFTWEPGKARLDKQGKVNAWTAGHSDQSQWLQVRWHC